MANRQVARVDDSWYGGSQSTDDDRDNKRIHRTDDSCVSRLFIPQETEIQKHKKFSLPMEPTESVDKSREYPPIVTVDGRVDTDIDHLMENTEDETTPDTPVQDIPSPFPKPHVVRVIDGSLDDDIDNLVNHDGTMAHTLVDAPKNFRRGDLKEINSSTSQSSSPSNRKEKSITSRHNQTPRISKRMNRDGSDEDNGMQATPGSKVVPYFERNNSSKAPTINNDDADFCHLKQSLEEGFVSPPPDLDEVNVTFAAKESEYLPVCDRIKEGEKDVKLPGDRGTEHSKEEHVEDNIDRSTKSEDFSQAENASDLDKGEVTEAGDISREASIENQNVDLPSDSISQVVEHFLKTKSKEELEKRLSIESDAAVTSVEEKETHDPVKSKENKKVKTEDPALLSGSEQKSNEVGLDNNQSMTSEPHQEIVSKVSDSIQKSTEISIGSSSMHETICLLKQSLEIIAKDSSESNQITESQKMLAVTALKVAGESMTAAAKMADALTLLVQSSQAGNKPFERPNPFKDADDKIIVVPAETVSEPSMARNGRLPQTRKPTQLKEGGTFPSSSTRERARNDTGLENVIGGDFAHDSEEINAMHLPEGEERDNEKVFDGAEILNKSRERNETEVKGNVTHEGKTQRKHRDHDDRSGRDPESKSSGRGEYKKIHGEKRRRENKQSGMKEDHHRKRSSRRAEEVMHMDEEISVNDEHYLGNPKSSYGYLNDMDKKMWEHVQRKQRVKENPEELHYEFYKDPRKEAENWKEGTHYDPDGGKRREKKKAGRDDHHKRSRNHTSSPQHRSKSTLEIPPMKEHDINESRSPKAYDNDYDTAESYGKKSSRSSRHDCEENSSRKCVSSKHSSQRQLEEDVFFKSDRWILPNGEQYPIQGEHYFDQVVRQLKPYSPVKNSNAQLDDPQRNYFRAKLVGSCVDPHARDSDFDSIEFNANARPSDSIRVHFDDEEEWHYCED